jgi:hypothetical protein
MRVFTLLILSAVLSLAADITGKWKFTVESEMGSTQSEWTFEQKGEKLTGTYKGQLGEHQVSGTVTGNSAVFGFKAAPTGEEMEVKYTATIESPTKMRGKVSLGSLGSGTFVGEKQ